MGCLYACTCGSNCLNCSTYKPEQYYGHAEDVLAQTKGFSSVEEMDYSNESEKEYEDYCSQQHEYIKEQNNSGI